MPTPPPTRPNRLLIVMPSWVGDAVMATPAARLLRELLPGAFIGALVRPGVDDLLAGLTLFDETHVARPTGVMGPKRAAAKLRPRRYDTALLLTNSFSTALVTRIAGIPRRVGYDRDARTLLLTDRLDPPKRRDTPPYSKSDTDPGAWAPIPACDYYHAAAAHLLKSVGITPAPMGPLELAVTRDQQAAADDILDRAEVPPPARHERRVLIINPGGNNPAKRWPPERFAALATTLAQEHDLHVLINGSPKEADLTTTIAELIPAGIPTANLPELGITLGALKGLTNHARLMVTNDTGPRHIAAALGVPVVTLFGPTDHRWTTIPFTDERTLLADPTLPAEEVANDHPDRCDVSNITLDAALAAARDLLKNPPTAAPPPPRRHPHHR